MTIENAPASSGFIPLYALYGEEMLFPDVLHCEMISDRASLHDWTIAPHRHQNLHQFFLILRGQTIASMDGEIVNIDPPTLISVPSPTVHSFQFAKGTEGYVLTVPTHELETVFSARLDTAKAMASPRVLAATPELQSLFNNTFAEHRNLFEGRVAMLRSLVTQIACFIIRNAGKAAEDVDEPSARAHVIRFENLVRQNFSECWSVSDYAAELGMSATHLNRVARSMTGQSALQFINGMLFQEARSLLAYTRIDIAEIGYKLGFDDPSYFSRAFKRMVGVSPKKYRYQLDW